IAGVEDAALLAPLLRVVVKGHAGKGIREGMLEVPCPAEIILAARAFDRGLGGAVDVELVVALAPPAIAVGHHAEKGADIMSAAGALQDQVVFAFGYGKGLAILGV